MSTSSLFKASLRLLQVFQRVTFSHRNKNSRIKDRRKVFTYGKLADTRVISCFSSYQEACVRQSTHIIRMRR